MPETTVVSIASALTAVQLAPPGRCRCQTCGRQLHDGHPVQVYAYQPADQPEWSVPRVYCRDCSPGKIETPTLGCREALVDAWLGTLALCAGQTARLVLTDVTVAEQSPASEGARP